MRGFPLLRFLGGPERETACTESLGGHECVGKSEALYDFTKAKPCRLLDAGVDVGMVQVGNEINNNGMAGEEDVDTVMDLIIRKPCGA